MNLYKETIDVLRFNNKFLKDIDYVELDDRWFNISDYKILADVDYDNSTGVQLVNKDLRLYGDNFFLERWLFDGIEGWSFVDIRPDKPFEYGKPDSLLKI